VQPDMKVAKANCLILQVSIAVTVRAFQQGCMA